MDIPLTYFLWRHGQVYGPYSGQELNSFLAQGRAKLSDMARTEGMSQWAPLFTIWPGASAPPLGMTITQAPEAAVGTYPAGSNTAALATEQQAIIDVQPSPQSNPVSWAASIWLICFRLISCSTRSRSRSRWLKAIRSVSIGPSATYESGHFYFAQTGHSHFAATARGLTTV